MKISTVIATAISLGLTAATAVPASSTISSEPSSTQASVVTSTDFASPTDLPFPTEAIVAQYELEGSIDPYLVDNTVYFLNVAQTTDAPDYDEPELVKRSDYVKTRKRKWFRILKKTTTTSSTASQSQTQAPVLTSTSTSTSSIISTKTTLIVVRTEGHC